MDFCEKLQRIRKDKEWTQEQLAEKLFVSRTAVSKWESGRGYPSIDSLKAISKLFSISIDELLSGEELITIAEADNRDQVRGIRDLVFGVLDCMVVLLFFLPLFGQAESGMVRHVSLLSLETYMNIKIAFVSFAVISVVFGIAELGLLKLQHQLWLRNKLRISLFFSVIGLMLYMASPQVYADIFMLGLLLFKGFLLIKKV